MRWHLTVADPLGYELTAIEADNRNGVVDLFYQWLLHNNSEPVMNIKIVPWPDGHLEALEELDEEPV